MSGQPALIRVAPFHYIHVLDNNSNVQRVELGPITFARADHEKLTLKPAPMIVVPPAHYCVIADPYVRSDEKTKSPKTDEYGQVMLRHGDTEIRFSTSWTEPFPLLPGERLVGSVEPLIVVAVDSALRLEADRDFHEEGKEFKAGDEWLFVGPATYFPRVEVTVKETIRATVIPDDHALKLQARREFTLDGVTRKAGEEWLVRQKGTYLPSVFEKDMGLVQPNFLLGTRALHLRAIDNFTDAYGAQRKAGEEWLVTSKDSEMHIVGVSEESIGCVDVTVLNKLQYCVVLNPVVDGRNQYGRSELRKGQCSFFLLPGETLDGGIQDVYVLGAESALLLRSKEKFVDQVGEQKIQRTPGDMWMINGPCDYVPLVEVDIVEERHSIPLDENEGIYLRDVKTGRVRSISGQTYMLKSNEELWEKDLPVEVEALLQESNGGQKRDRSRVVSYRVPHNSAVQIFDYKTQKSRYVCGPNLVMLAPEEQFTVMSLSGSKPKRPNVIKTLAIMMGPDFMTDILEVESSDHARLRLQLSYNWDFQFQGPNEENYQKMFQVRDFVGDACKAIASRVRTAVATQSFDEFHKHSAQIIRAAVFGRNEETGKLNDNFMIMANCLCITNIDIQNVEPVDERTRESLQKSVQLAIEITTKKQERNARHDAEGIEQDARGKIERQKILNLKDAEEARQDLIQLQAESAAIQSTGTAKAEAEAKAEYLILEGEAEVKRANLEAEASDIESQSTLEELTKNQEEEMDFQQKIDDLELTKQAKMADIETEKFNALVQAIKPETIKAIARAGPEMQARLLKGLGLKGYLMTDGNSPINLFNAAKGMVGAGDMVQSAGMNMS